MGSVTNSLSGLSYLMQVGGPLSNLASRMSPAQLQSAQPEELVSLSMAQIRTQQAEGLFGISGSSQTTLPAMPVQPFAPAAASGSASPTEILPGVAAADLTNATPQQNAAINNQAMLLQQVQGLFAEPSLMMGSTDAFA
jgi:hypothetical protein